MLSLILGYVYHDLMLYKRLACDVSLYASMCIILYSWLQLTLKKVLNLYIATSWGIVHHIDVVEDNVSKL